MAGLRFVLPLLIAASVLPAQKRVLHVTHSAGFVHGSIPFSERVLERESAATGKLQVVSTQDLSFISAERLAEFDAIFFFTSGELPLTDSQKTALLQFVRDGKGFGSVHSATDTFYTWPEYGELIGAYFDGHPWVQEISIDVEDPDHPAMRHLAPSWRITDEIYQFRNFSRDRVRVLMTIDTRTIDLNLDGVNRKDEDFALAWCRNYGRGRVFYTALGHGEETWADPRFQKMLVEALLWLTAQSEGEGAPRAAAPKVAAQPVVAPGAVISIEGEGLTSGSTMYAPGLPLPVKLGGTLIRLNGRPLPLLSASPNLVRAVAPFELSVGDEAALEIHTPPLRTPVEPVRVEAAAPAIEAVAPESARAGAVISIYATGLGAVNPPVASGAVAPLSPLSRTTALPEVLIGGRPAAVQFSGLAPLQVSLYQVNAVIPEGLAPGTADIVLRMNGRDSRAAPIIIMAE